MTMVRSGFGLSFFFFFFSLRFGFFVCLLPLEGLSARISMNERAFRSFCACRASGVERAAAAAAARERRGRGGGEGLTKEREREKKPLKSFIRK